MAQPPIIIIHGLPGTGKTVLGLKLAEKFGIPYISKDGFKELLFDELGVGDREWSSKLGLASFSLIFHSLEQELKARRSCIVEGNFHAEYAPIRFTHLQKKYNFRPMQILCYAEGEVVFERYRQRAYDGSRHPGHLDVEMLEYLRPRLLKGRDTPLEIEGPLIEIDTTDFAGIDYPAIFRSVQNFLSAD